MTPLSKGLVSAVLLAIIAFCGFGFMATFEPPGFIGWRIIYGVGGLACLLGIVGLALPGPKNP